MIQWKNLQELLNEPRSKAKLSKATGISTGNISDWFNPDKNAQPSADALVKIAKHFECSVDYLLDRTDIKEVNSEPTTIYRFPVFDQRAAAGVGILNNSDGYEMEEYQIDNIPDSAVFAMKIKGDSMYDEETGHIKDKATILVNPRDTNFEGKIVIANLDGECVCKRYTTIEDHVELKSDNEFRQDENKDSRNYREPKVIGVVLGVIDDNKFIPIK